VQFELRWWCQIAKKYDESGLSSGPHSRRKAWALIRCRRRRNFATTKRAISFSTNCTWADPSAITRPLRRAATIRLPFTSYETNLIRIKEKPPSSQSRSSAR